MGFTIGYDNILRNADATVTATGATSGNPVDNVYDWRTTTIWEAAAGGTNYITLSLVTPAAVDYIGVFGHNLHECAGTLTLQKSTDGGSTWGDVSTPWTPTDGGTLLEVLATGTEDDWRVKIVSTTAPYIACIAFGTALVMPQQVQAPWTPPPLARKVRVTNQQTDGGQFAGRSKYSAGIELSGDFVALTHSFALSSWLALMEHAEDYAFFVSWDPANYASHAAIVWAPDGELPNPTLDPVYARVSLSVVGRLS